MASKREDILNAIKTALANTTGVGTRIYRSRTIPLQQRSELPALLISWSTDTAEQNTSLPTLDWSLSVTVTILSSGDVPDSQADNTLISMHSKIMADLTLGGEAIDVEPTDQSFEAVDADQPLGAINCSYLVRYRTEVDDLTQ
tara:strand:+ start:283 stop:711 length:429 start_codon:yes stop_codon:yes gene_type:complete